MKGETIEGREPLSPFTLLSSHFFSPVAQRRRQLPYKETIGGSSPPRATRLGRQSADHLGLEPRMLWVRVPPEPLSRAESRRAVAGRRWSLRFRLSAFPFSVNNKRPRGAARSARLPVTQEIVGSNPIGDARQRGTVRKSAKRRSSNLRDRLWVRLPPVPLD